MVSISQARPPGLHPTRQEVAITAPDTIRSLIQRAVPAPSSRNSQPWCFRVAEYHIDLLADRTRAAGWRPVRSRELVIIFCGAALLTQRAAAA